MFCDTNRNKKIEEDFLWRIEEFIEENGTCLAYANSHCEEGFRVGCYNEKGNVNLDISLLDTLELERFVNYYGTTTIIKEYKVRKYEDYERIVIYAYDMPYTKYDRTNNSIFKVYLYEGDWKVVREYKSAVYKEVAVGGEE